MAGFAELRDSRGRPWRCDLPDAAVSVAVAGQPDDAWADLVGGIDADSRPEVVIPWWMVESEQGSATVEAVDRRRRRFIVGGLVAMVLSLALALTVWSVPLSFVPEQARGGLGFLIIVLLGLPSFGIFVTGSGTLQFGFGMRERSQGQARRERAEQELATLGAPNADVMLVLDDFPAGAGGAQLLARVVQRVLARDRVRRALIVTRFRDRRAELDGLLGGAVAATGLEAVASTGLEAPASTGLEAAAER